MASASGTATIDRTKYDIKYGSKSFFESIGDKAIIQSKANDGAVIAAAIAEGKGAREDLQLILSTEWTALCAISALVVASIAIGTWRPALRFSSVKSQAQATLP